MNKCSAFLAMAALAAAGATEACTDFQVRSADGSVIIARSMEFPTLLESEVLKIPRGQTVASRTSDGKTGLSWTSKYGFLGVNAFHDPAGILDGMNEAGLSVEFLWFPGSRYQEAGNGPFLAVNDLAVWILGNFSDTGEVSRAISRTSVVGAFIPQLGQVPGFHAAVHDAAGKNLVIEFIDGETKIHDNPLGVMTNRPAFDWQLANLRNYVGLKPDNTNEKKFGGVEIEATGEGNGWIGLPGDWTPPSRFVRVASFLAAALPAENAARAVILAEHILDTVDIPRGVIRDTDASGKTAYELTQWSVIKDLTNRVLYFRSYDNHSLRMIDLKKLDLSPGSAVTSFPLAAEHAPEDATGRMRQAP